MQPTVRTARRRRPVRHLLFAAIAVALLVPALGAAVSRATSPAGPAVARPADRAPALPARRAVAGEADGVVPAGTTVDDDGAAGVANLDPRLREALRAAAADAIHDGVTFVVDSGWRSRAYQRQLFREAVAKHGSSARAARWVARPGTSRHETGDAVDLGREAASWLAAHGARYGLCRVYDNEPWHFELRGDARERRCPPTYADATSDPALRH